MTTFDNVQVELKEYLDINHLVTIYSSSHLTLARKSRTDKKVGQWTKMMDDASAVKRLSDSVKIQICPCNKAFYLPEDDVSVYVDVKNVPKLLVKVFEINTMNYYSDKKSEVTSDLNLDGMVASEEEQCEYKEAPILQVRRYEIF